MNCCENGFGLIEDLLDGELDEPTAGRITAHILACPACQKQYEGLEREKEIYAHYLFDAEPPQDLSLNFQKRLGAEKAKSAGKILLPVNRSREKTNIFRFLRLSPAPALGVVALLVLGAGFIWINVAPVEQDLANLAADSGKENRRIPLTSGKIDAQPRQGGAEKNAPDAGGKALKRKLPAAGEKSVKTRKNPPAAERSIAAEIVKTRRQTGSSSAGKTPTPARLPNAEQRLLAARRQVLEKEIAGQIEKVELLLRSFRNARTAGNVETFDLEYERTRARALLEKNTRLRREVEGFGIFYAEELLSRVEPLLLDIANLEANPASSKVLDIKERVNNQNIIASLQVYK